MSPEQQQQIINERMSFREWTEHYEREQEADREKINAIADGLVAVNQSVGRLSAVVESLVDNQKGVYSRLNRPWQWGVVVSVFLGLFAMIGAFATVLTLTVNPLKDNLKVLENSHSLDVNRDLELHMWFRDNLEATREDIIRNETNVEWLKRMEERQYNQSHKGESR